jgi:hypothetical protein
MLYCVVNWDTCNNSQLEVENKRFLILIDEYYGVLWIFLFGTVYAFSIESEWFFVTSLFPKVFFNVHCKIWFILSVIELFEIILTFEVEKNRFSILIDEHYWEW